METGCCPTCINNTCKCRVCQGKDEELKDSDGCYCTYKDEVETERFCYQEPAKKEVQP